MMKKIFAFLLCSVAVASCSKHDPILPGERADIFDSYEVNVKNKELPDLSAEITNVSGDEKCEYRQDAQNTIWAGDKKIWSGFSTNNAVKSKQAPVSILMMISVKRQLPSRKSFQNIKIRRICAMSKNMKSSINC